MALAKVVLPVPGGPNSTTARGGTTPYWSARSGLAKGSTSRRSRSSFSRCIPPTAFHRFLAINRPPSSPSRPISCRWTGISRSKYRRCFLSMNPEFRSASIRCSVSGTSVDSLVSPRGAIRFSMEASIPLPMPRLRQLSSMAKNTIQPWSWAALATAAPTTVSPCTATTAWSFWQEASTSASAYTGSTPALWACSHRCRIASISAAWKSRIRQPVMVCPYVGGSSSASCQHCIGAECAGLYDTPALPAADAGLA